MTLHVQAVEIYFNDCFDLLNNKAKVMIKGFGRNVASAGLNAISVVNNRGHKGKWIPPAVYTKKDAHSKK